MSPTGASPAGAETPSKQKQSTSRTSAETFFSRGLSNDAPGKPTDPRDGADGYCGVSPGHPLTSSSNGGTHNASVMEGVLGGVSGNYNPTFQSTYSNTGIAPTGMPFVPGSSPYNPTPVPQVSPFHITAGNSSVAEPAALATPGNTHNSQGESASYYSAPQTGTSVTSSSGSTVHPQHTSSGFGHSLESKITSITNAVQGHAHNHNHNHDHNGPPPPLRQSVRKLWENIRAEERYAIGQFEIYSESIGVCKGCFDPGSSPVQAPRTHHYGQRLTKNGWRARRKTSRRVWFFRRKDSSTYSPSEGTSSSESTASVSDSDLSDTTRKRRILEKHIRREKKELRRSEQQEFREREGYASRHRRGSGSSHTKISTTRSGAGLLHGGDLDKSKEHKPYYNPGYADGQAHPTFYSGPSTYEKKKQLSKSSGSVLGGLLGYTNRSRGHKRVSSRVSRTSSNTSLQGESIQFTTKSSGAAASSDALVYGRYSSSPNSLKSKKKGWLFGLVKKDQVSGKGERKKERGGKGKSLSSSSSRSSSRSSPSSDGLAYGRFYDSRKGTSLDSISVRSKQSNAGSVSESVKSAGSSVFEFGRVQQRKSLDDYGTPGSISRPGSAVVGYDPTKRNLTAGSRTVTQSLSASRSVAAPTPGGWGWFGGGSVEKPRSMSMSSMESGVGMGDNVRDQFVFPTTGGGATRHSGSEASIAGAKSYSSTNMTSDIRKGKENEIFMQRRNSESRILTSTSAEDKKVKEREVWIQDSGRRERSPDRFSIATTGSRRRASSTDSWESDSRQPRTEYQKSSTKKPTSTTTRTGFLGLFSGRSEGRREESKASSKEGGWMSAKPEELRGSKKEKTSSLTTKEERMIGENATSSTTYGAGTPKEEESTKLQKIYPMVCRLTFLGS